MSQRTGKESRLARHARVRRKVRGTAERPRVAVFRSLRHITAQVIDDVQGRTLCSITTSAKAVKDALGQTGNIKAAHEAGKMLGEKMKAAGITEAVFDRGGFLYHGRIKAFAEGTREAGIKI